MGGYFSKKKEKEDGEKAEGEGEGEQAPTEAPPVDTRPRLICKWDSVEVKRAFDDLATQIILEKGYKEDMYVSNVKILLGGITCALALLAQFHPSKFPANYNLTLACVVGYFFFNTLLQLYGMYKAMDVILFTHPKEGQAGVGGLEVSSNLPRFSDIYSLTIEGTARRNKPARLESSIAAWIHEDGIIEEPIFRADVERLLVEATRGKASKKDK